METEITKGAWKFIEWHRPKMLKICSQDNDLIADVYGSSEAPANAAYICKAVNNFETMLDALQEVSDAYRGITELYLAPSQKAALKKVDDTLIQIKKAESI